MARVWLMLWCKGVTGVSVQVEPATTTLMPRAHAFDPASASPSVDCCHCCSPQTTGDLVVTKGDQYDVREREGERDVRNLGKPVDLAAR